MTPEDLFLAAMILGLALLYSSVGHAGASGYLAAMALVGLAPEVMRPVALTLNIFVAIVATIKFYRAGAFSWDLFWPFAAASIPFAFLGGVLTLPGLLYKPLVGAVLVYAAWRSFRTADRPIESTAPRPHPALMLSVGAVLGFLSGLTGVGGGIFLSPLLLFFRLAEIRIISGTVAAFILANSVAGLLGVVTTSVEMPAALPFWGIAALAGGFVGSEFGSRRLKGSTIQKTLAAVLAIAGIKMLLGG